MATPCTNLLGGESRGHRHEGGEGRSVCWKCAAVSWAGAGWPSMLIEGAEGLILFEDRRVYYTLENKVLRHAFQLPGDIAMCMCSAAL